MKAKKVKFKVTLEYELTNYDDETTKWDTDIWWKEREAIIHDFETRRFGK